MTIKSILILGGHGYIGSELRGHLQKDFVLTVPTRQELDLAKPETFSFLKNKKFDLIINLAAKVAGLKPQEFTDDLLTKNVSDLNQFLHYIVTENTSARLLHLSSMSVYGKQTSVEQTEETPLNPQSLYALSKKMSEDIVNYHAQNFAGLKVVNLRVPGVYGGKRESGLLYQTKKFALANETITINTKGLINWETIHLTDLCLQIASFLKHYPWDKPAQTFNLGYGHRTDIIETVRFIVKNLKSNSEVMIQEKDYDDFYMSTKKINPYVDVTSNFETSLLSYIRE